MAGVRLTHPTFRGIVVAVPHEGRPFPSPRPCTTCKTSHRVKTYHLTLDGEGACIVSATVLERLTEIGFVPLAMQVESEVFDPPTQIVLPPTARPETNGHRPVEIVRS